MDNDQLKELVQTSTFRSRLDRQLGVKLNDEQYRALTLFRGRVAHHFSRPPLISEYKMALEIIDKGIIRRRKVKKKGSAKSRIRRIMIKRYGVPESMIDEYDRWFEDYGY
jgi:hypothetical protein